MKKKEIEKIPFRGGVRADKQYRNTAVAFLQDIRGENHLFVEVYENKKQELQTPWIRMVFTQKDWGLYYPDAGVWSAAGLDEEREKIGSNCKKRDNKCYMARSQGDMVWKFTGDTWERKYTTWVGALQSLIYNIKAQRVQKREDKRADRLKEREQNTPPLPKGLEDWAKKTGIGTEHFLYYKRHGRYADITCSACGQVTEAAVRRKDTYEGQFEKIIPVPQHDSVGTCPHCGATGIYKAQGKTKGVWGHGMNCFIAQRYKDDGAVIPGQDSIDQHPEYMPEPVQEPDIPKKPEDSVPGIHKEEQKSDPVPENNETIPEAIPEKAITRKEYLETLTLYGWADYVAAAMRTFGSIPFSRLREISFWEEWLRGKVDKKGRPWIE